MPHTHDSSYRRCSISVMDTIADPGISFDEKGICNYYYEYQAAVKKLVVTGEEGEALLAKKYAEIRQAGKGRKYDCIIGVSGGIDSTYLCLQAARNGLRPLLVHCDNSWNSEKAIHNIERVVRALKFDLYTHLINWKEFRDLELAYLRASVVDIDILTDHAFVAVLYRLARKWRIPYVLAGTNIVSEEVLPRSWRHNSGDAVNIHHIVRQYGNIDLRRMKTFPVQRYYNKAYCHHVLGIRILHPFDYGDYSIAKAEAEIIREFGWEPFEGKHFDSIWTRFYQGYILPRKFGIDKRKAHFSNLIFSGQMTREQALEQLSKPPYPPALLQKDLDMFLRKMSLTEEELDALIALPRQEHSMFKAQQGFAARFPFAVPIVKWAQRFRRGRISSVVASMILSHPEIAEALAFA